MSHIVVVSTCTKAKSFVENERLPARDAYAASYTHRLTRDLVDQLRGQGHTVSWWILSAMFGFLTENRVISNYNKVLKTKDDAKVLASRTTAPVDFILSWTSADRGILILSETYHRYLKIVLGLEGFCSVPTVVHEITGKEGPDYPGKSGSGIRNLRLKAYGAVALIEGSA
jgi:hypothetical protein